MIRLAFDYIADAVLLVTPKNPWWTVGSRYFSKQTQVQKVKNAQEWENKKKTPEARYSDIKSASHHLRALFSWCRAQRATRGTTTRGREFEYRDVFQVRNRAIIHVLLASGTRPVAARGEINTEKRKSWFVLFFDFLNGLTVGSERARERVAALYIYKKKKKRWLFEGDTSTPPIYQHQHLVAARLLLMDLIGHCFYTCCLVFLFFFLFNMKTAAPRALFIFIIIN